MTETVIEQFESVDIEEHYPEAQTAAERFAQARFDFRFEIAAVAQLGQAVEQRQLFEFLDTQF